ncbi:hypothetical protein T484DRAFT_1921096 [Baffinella frigidus]|nr:hypothetical protein T484DRAFT_1921096 [Cryptophyta sp. CCMP2293]
MSGGSGAIVGVQDAGVPQAAAAQGAASGASAAVVVPAVVIPPPQAAAAAPGAASGGKVKKKKVPPVAILSPQEVAAEAAARFPVGSECQVFIPEEGARCGGSFWRAEVLKRRVKNSIQVAEVAFIAAKAPFLRPRKGWLRLDDALLVKPSDELIKEANAQRKVKRALENQAEEERKGKKREVREDKKKQDGLDKAQRAKDKADKPAKPVQDEAAALARRDEQNKNHEASQAKLPAPLDPPALPGAPAGWALRHRMLRRRKALLGKVPRGKIRARLPAWPQTQLARDARVGPVSAVSSSALVTGRRREGGA